MKDKSSSDAFFEFISYSRTPNNGRLNQMWGYSYKAIAQASNIINMVAEGQSPEVDGKLGEMYFVRGMLYFYLCRVYGRPYYQKDRTDLCGGKTCLGVPIVNGTPPDIVGQYALPDRATVEDTYKQILRDLSAAERLMGGMPERYNAHRPSYASLGAAWAMLSLVYLYMSGTYDNPDMAYAAKAAEYADKVIGSGVYELLARDRFMIYNTLVPEDNKETIFATKWVTADKLDMGNSIGSMYAVVSGSGWGELYPSAKYLALLNEAGRCDWRRGIAGLTDARAAFIEPQYSSNNRGVFRFIVQTVDAGKPAYNYLQLDTAIVAGALRCGTKNSSGVLTGTTYPLTLVDAGQDEYKITYGGATYSGYIDNFITVASGYPMYFIYKCSREGEDTHLHSPVISRLAEVYLNKAEALVKTGDLAGAREALNAVRNRSLPNKGYDAAEFTAQTAPSLVDKERTLELAFQAERSFDVYRNGGALERKYPGYLGIGNDRVIEVSPDDYRVVFYIPQTAINSYPSGSTLTQNPTSN